ncbi:MULTISPECIES: helix-turn-helix domain-containing protein [unclassified Enterococcus]|uniref:helix-turn-helix domain-containing protein n=1 Tax=unclassified Enterococcus TaxID=2608891 RepID=UPI0013EA7F1A|nr:MULTISPECIES: helix-turn-helix domain-containing protein [unclassified Enterococcus]
MLDLLSKKLQRHLKIIVLLFEGGVYRFGDLKELLDCSSKTLRNDLLDINSYIKGIEIKSDREAGVTAVISSHIAEDYIYRSVMNESIEYTYLEAILMRKFNNYLELAEHLFVSESTLRRLAKKIASELQKYGLRIQGLTKIVGDDQMLTILTVRLLMEKYQVFEEAFDPSLCKKVKRAIQLFMQENRLSEPFALMEPQEDRFLCFFIACRIIRWNEKKCAEMEKETADRFTFHQLVNDSQKQERTIPAISWEGWQYVFEDTIVFGLLKMRRLEAKTTGCECHEELAEMIRVIEKKYQLYCKDKTKIILNITNDLRFLKIPFYILYDPTRAIYKNIQNEFDHLKEELMSYFRRITQTIGKDHQMTELISQFILFELLTNWPELLKKMEQKNRRIRALLLVDSTQVHVNYIIRKLQDYLGNRYEFTISMDFSMNNHLIQRSAFDCVISNRTLIEPWKIPVFGISVFPNSRELRNLLYFHHRLIHKTHKPYKTIEENIS